MKQEKYTKIITDFLRSHPVISVLGVEKELNLPSSTIRSPMAGLREIPTKHIFPIIGFLANYGLQIEGYNLKYDPEDGTLSARKWVENMEVIEVESETGSHFEYIVKEYRWIASDYFDLL